MTELLTVTQWIVGIAAFLAVFSLMWGLFLLSISDYLSGKYD